MSLCHNVIVIKLTIDQGDETEGLEMEGLEMKAVALMNYMRSGTYTFAFPKLGYFAGFSLFIIRRKDQRSCDGKGQGIIFHSLGAP